MSVIFIVDVRSADTICIQIKNICYLRLKSIIINEMIFLLYVFAVAAEIMKIIIITAAVEDRQQTEKRQ